MEILLLVWIAQLSAMALVKRPGDNGVLVELPKKQKPTRYSDLQAPTMKLEGHQGALLLALSDLWDYLGAYDDQNPVLA